ncbi:MAG: hypothetical protein IKS76_02145 [Paludibacteraceae bacterium]|nr:hypothetical protein [Paludibacteraceae bacterium]
MRRILSGKTLPCLLLAAIPASIALTSCNVTRVVETKSEYFTKGDTTCTIITKTVESYDASKKAF